MTTAIDESELLAFLEKQRSWTKILARYKECRHCDVAITLKDLTDAGKITRTVKKDNIYFRAKR